MLYKTNWFQGRSTKMAAAMTHKVVMLFQLRTSSIRPTIRNFHRLTSPRSLSVCSVQLKGQKQRNTNDFLFTSGRIFSVSDVLSLSVRFNSSSGDMVDVPYIPPPPKIPSEIPDSIVSETVDVVNALGEPTLQSLGLGSWSPVGIIQQLTEFLHITLDIPWWGSICLLTVILRVLMFPIFVKSQRNAVMLHNIMPEMTKRQERFTDAKRSQDVMSLAIAHKDLTDFMNESKFSPLMMMYPVMQAPVFISVFWGLKGMSNAPVESMKDGGIFWFTDLTLADPTFFLPVICSGLLLATIEVGADGIRSDTMGTGGRWLMRGLPIVLIPIMMNFPSAVLCYWVTSNTISMILVAFFKIPGVKPFLKIPERIAHKKQLKSTNIKKPMFKGFMDNWENAKLQERMRKKDRMDLSVFKEAGTGPIPKTYTVDPTGGRPKKAKRDPNSWQMPWNKMPWSRKKSD